MVDLARLERGIGLLEKGAVTYEGERTVKKYTVIGSTGEEYTVEHDIKDDTWTCSCPDFDIRSNNCKHIYAVILSELE